MRFTCPTTTTATTTTEMNKIHPENNHHTSVIIIIRIEYVVIMTTMQFSSMNSEYIKMLSHTCSKSSTCNTSLNAVLCLDILCKTSFSILFPTYHFFGQINIGGILFNRNLTVPYLIGHLPIYNKYSSNGLI